MQVLPVQGALRDGGRRVMRGRPKPHRILRDELHLVEHLLAAAQLLVEAYMVEQLGTEDDVRRAPHRIVAVLTVAGERLRSAREREGAS